jgi:hypothetical protein
MKKQTNRVGYYIYGQSDPGWFFNYEIAGTFLFLDGGGHLSKRLRPADRLADRQTG